jgi:hypothetical protein
MRLVIYPKVVVDRETMSHTTSSLANSATSTPYLNINHMIICNCAADLQHFTMGRSDKVCNQTAETCT